MRITQISAHIWRLRIWMLVPIQVWLVVEKDGISLVDAGMSVMAGGILKTLPRLKAGPLQRILLTHGHPDHVGALKPLLAKTPVPVYAHRLEIPYLTGERSYRPKKKAAAVLPPGSIRALPENGDNQLQAIGGLTPYFAPGHSPGHTVYYHEKDRVLLAGDLFWSKKGKLLRPRFTADMEEALRSSAIVSRLQPERLEVCHGDSVFHAAAQIASYLEQSRHGLSGASVRNGL